LKNNISLFFSLDRKEAKDQDCKKMTKNFTHPITEIELVPISSGLKQQFLFNIEFVHSLNVIFLRSRENTKVILMARYEVDNQVGRLDTLISISGKNSYFKTSKCPKL
jgi:hypothetical protein